ncbi:hypothetical protein GDO86_010835 [Hymenochirus boettgeri]|uniref:Uncharacterized protein n=1 Tax=Hymenochirus boettgeri TaxID=247094 RepID=A0A8T2JEA4_9PIPI|nr:hypothetical protein GDO86_010835 [Hymenochirus boettgeri]
MVVPIYFIRKRYRARVKDVEAPKDCVKDIGVQTEGVTRNEATECNILMEEVIVTPSEKCVEKEMTKSEKKKKKKEEEKMKKKEEKRKKEEKKQEEKKRKKEQKKIEENKEPGRETEEKG